MNVLNQPASALQHGTSGFLGAFRRFLGDAWFLHGWVIASVVVLPFPRPILADEDGFEHASTESFVEISIDVPEGTSGLIPGMVRSVTITATTHSWEIWTNSSTNVTETRNDQYTPLVGVTVSAGVDYGDGQLSLGNTLTDSQGKVTGTFISGVAGSRITVSSEGAQASLDFTPPDAELWGFDHSEGLIQASLSSDGSTDNVASGETRSLEVTVTYSSWDVETSSYGNSRTTAPQWSPASGATIYWVLVEGDGTLTTGSSSTDSAGKAAAAFGMGVSPSIIRADVSYASSQSTNATIAFQPPPPGGYQFASYGESYSIGGIEVTDGTNGLPQGQQRVISAVLYHNTWENWEDGNGNSEQRSANSVPAPYLPFSASLEYGDGDISPGPATSDANGVITRTFTMGSAESRVLLYPPDYPDQAVGVNFTPELEVWTHVDDGSDTVMEIEAAGYDLIPNQQQQVSARIVSRTWENWSSNTGGVEKRNEQSVPVVGQAITFAITSGSGSVSPQVASGGADGWATTMLTMAADSSQVSVFPTGAPEGPAADAVFSLIPETWEHDHDEATVAVSLTADGPTTCAPGAARALTGHVTYTTWQVWRSTWGFTENRSETSGVAINAETAFWQESGDGVLSGVSSTDVNGDATASFTMGSSASVVRLAVSYAGLAAEASLTFDRIVDWEQTGSGAELLVTMSEVSSGYPRVVAQVQQRTWEIWTLGSVIEERNSTIGPAIGAAVEFSILAGSGTLATPSGSTGPDAKCASTYVLTEPSTIQATVTFDGLTQSASISPQVFDPNGDDDGDRLTNAQEWLAGTSFQHRDTDGDGVWDGQEIAEGTDPNDDSSNSRLFLGLRVTSTLIRAD